jgi:hypothetical protein
MKGISIGGPNALEPVQCAPINRREIGACDYEAINLILQAPQD